MPYPELQEVQVLVTGGAGFIGSHLVDALLERGARVRVLDNLSTGSLDNLAHCRDRIELIEGDIREADHCRQACRGAAFVFHQAALGSVPRSMEDPASTFAVNVQGTVSIFEAARQTGVRRIVYASSSSVYGLSERLPRREGEEGAPASPYALSKLQTEEVAQIFARCYQLASVGLRYFNVYGPRQDPDSPYAAVIPSFFSALVAGKPPAIFGDGEQSRDFTYVADAARANLLAINAPASAPGRAFNVATGQSTPVNLLAEMVSNLVGVTLAPVHGPPRPGDARHSQADLTLAKAALGFDSAIQLQDGLELARDYYLGQLRRSDRVQRSR